MSSFTALTANGGFSQSQGQPPAIRAQAWQTQLRLARRDRHLVGPGKRAPLAVGACAREWVGFLWAALPQGALAAQAAEGRARAPRGEPSRRPPGAAGRRRPVWRALAVPWRPSGAGPGDSRE